MLGRRIEARRPPPTCLPELRRALLDEWCNILQDQIDNLILSMPRHSLEIKLTPMRHLKPSGRMVAYRASAPQVWVLFPNWARSTQPFIPKSGSINDYQACFGT
ncbi:transposable element Tc3 transposase [Trichonephila clavipes]|nr:transposable element Tc3 transposase [Trichonephila clavipes]